MKRLRYIGLLLVVVPLLGTAAASSATALPAAAAERPGNTDCPAALPAAAAERPGALALSDAPTAAAATPAARPARAGRLMAHFWDGVDFGDTLRSRNRPFVEERFARFAALLPHGSARAQARAVRRLMRAAGADPGAYRLIAEVAEQTLYTPGAPAYCEEHFIPFLEELADSPVLGPDERLRPRALLEAARMNRPGRKAADFGFRTRDGRPGRLATLRARRLLLFFYDPDCPDCTTVAAALDGDPSVAEAVRTGRLTVLAVATGCDSTAWRRSWERLPAGWIVAWDDREQIAAGDRYVLAELPVLYLLDGRRRVVLKEATVGQLSAAAEEFTNR